MIVLFCATQPILSHLLIFDNLKLIYLFYFSKTALINQTGEYAGIRGLGLLRLHSTFRHDLKIYASDEGRVQMTAAAFAKVDAHLQFTCN